MVYIIDNFIEAYNNLCNAYNKKFEDKGVREKIILAKVKKSRTLASEENNNSIVYNLLSNYIFKDSPFPLFSFLDKLKENKNYIFFGFSESYGVFYCTSKETKEILTLGDSFKINDYCAVNEVQFLLTLIEILNFKAKQINSKNKLSDNDLLNILEQCVMTSGGEKYRKFFSFYFLGK